MRTSNEVSWKYPFLSNVKSLQSGELCVWNGDSTNLFNTHIVLYNDEKTETVTLARPYGRGSCYGTTCPTVLVGYEKYNVSHTMSCSYHVLDRDSDHQDQRRLFYMLRCINTIVKAWKFMCDGENPIMAGELEFRTKAYHKEIELFRGQSIPDALEPNY